MIPQATEQGMHLRVAFRCDASLQIGTGHVARCLTLAHALRDGGAQVLFICRDLPGGMGAQIAAQGFGLTMLPPPPPDFIAPSHPPHASWAGIDSRIDSGQSRAAIDAAFADFGRPGDWLVVDHYAFDADWQGAVLGKATPKARLAVIDDLADRRHLADLLIDQNLGRHPQDYDALVPPHCEMLIGPSYALLRPEFAAMRSASLERRAQNGYPLEKVLITMGGIDLPNATEAALHGLARFYARRGGGDLQATVVMGAQAPALDRVRALAADLPFPAQVLIDVQNMAEVMAQADLAIGAAGSTAWERCALGLPSLVAVLADNQTPIAQALQVAGAATDLADALGADFADRLDAGLAAMDNPADLQAQSYSAAQVCQGLGLAVVVDAMHRPIALVDASQDDAAQVWAWRNSVPPSFFQSQTQPTLDAHLQWFEKALQQPQRRLFMAVDVTDQTVGHLRLDIAPPRANVSILLAPQARGLGYGPRLLHLLAHKARCFGLGHLDAAAQAGNIASLKAFASAGYRQIGTHDEFTQLTLALITD